MKGGKRIGAGAKLGSVRPKITDHWTQEDIADYFQHLKASYKTSDVLTKFVGEQLMGKAVQPVEGGLEITLPKPLLENVSNYHSDTEDKGS